MVELDRAPSAVDEVDGAGALVDERREVEHLEDALERHERGHHVDAGVRELRERLVDLRRRRCTNAATRADRDRVLDHEAPAEVVHDGGADRGDEAERHEQDPGVHRGGDADVAHAAAAPGEEVALAVVAAEQLHDERAGDVEPLGDGVVHRRVELHPLTRRDLELPPDPAGRDDERGEHEQREDREPPVERRASPPA